MSLSPVTATRTSAALVEVRTVQAYRAGVIFHPIDAATLPAVAR